MHSIVMPGGTDSEISYCVKCVVVESERVFGDMVVTQQTRNRLCWVNSCHYPDVSRIKLCNLTKKIFETPDFMALNRKPNRRELNVEVTAILPISGKTSVTKNTLNGKVNVNHVKLETKQKSYPLPMLKESANDDVVLSLVDQLLLDIYGYPRSERGRSESDSTASSYKPPPQHRYLRKARLLRKCKEELKVVLETLREHVSHAGGLLIRQLRRRDYLLAKRDKQYDVITAHLQAYSAKRSEDTRMRFSLTPQPGESGFTQWLDAMKMVARLQGGIPPEFRKRLWLTLAERHLEQRGVDWKQAEKLCFNEWSNPDDEELGIQIVKDLHRTGCSLFCGAAGRDNQAVLRRVLLGFARWNKSVGYCQGLNVLAAFVLQVTDRAESSAVKVMIYLIEGVLPEGYFADNLRGLSIDMAVFRDLLRMRLPKLSRHLEALQSDAKDKATGSSYEPPLTNVFTMQWFLTLFCHCLPQEAVLRVWDLIFLEGDEVLLRTALAIWEGISDRIMTVTSADEFYSIMGVLTREMLEFTDVNNLIKTIVNMGPLYGVTDLREKHRYNITPWARRLSDDEDTDTEEEEKLAVAAAMFGVSHRFKKDRSNASSSALQTINPANDRERLALDITTLKQQYAKLRERQRQAHIILSAACARQSMVPASTSQAMNHLLVGKSALVSAKTRQLGPPPGSIPPKPRTPVRHSPRAQSRRDKQAVTLHWKDTKKSKEATFEPCVGNDGESATSAVNLQEAMSATLPSPKRNSATDSDSDSTSTELCDEPDRLSDVDSEEPTSTSDCYVMATDDEKSPRPGLSPIAGNTPLRQSSEMQVTTKRDSTTLQVHNLTTENKVRDDYHSQDRLDIEETSSSIAKITDQIRRLSASDANNTSSIGLTETATDFKTVAEVGVQQESIKVVPLNDLCSANASIDEERFLKKTTEVSYETEEASQTNYPLSEKAFQMLDSYNFLSSSDMLGISNTPRDSEVLTEDKYREVAAEDVRNLMDAPLMDAPLEIKYHGAIDEESTSTGLNNTASSAVLISDFGMVQSNATVETARLLESFSDKDDNEAISKFESTSMRTDSYEKNRLDLNHSVVNDCSKYRDESQTTVSSINEQSAPATVERTFYSKSYVIGHLPISPATVTEKLSKAAEHSPLKDEFQSKEIKNFGCDGMENIDTTFSAAMTIGPETININYPSVLPITKSLTDHSESVNYRTSEDLEPNITSTSIAMCMDSKIADTMLTLELKNEEVRVFDCRLGKNGATSFETNSKIVSGNSTANLSPLNDNANTLSDNVKKFDYDLTRKFDTTAASSASQLNNADVNLMDGRKSSTNLGLIVKATSISPTRLSPDYTYHDSLSRKIYDDKKKSPKTPESAKSFSSGETMGPDSKTSSLTTSPRTPNQPDRKMFGLDKSECSSVSSDSKTLTLRSLDSDVGTNRTKLDSKSDVTRPSLDKSSPSTPISSDSLKNKSEISPKFVISSSSESCSPGKAKSSERSFSSELQSPISANSIKYRTNYVEGQDNLSESPMDICSATSPFYPIVNPNQNTPSPYGATGKQRNNTDSTETSPEQKSTRSKEEANSAKYKAESETVGTSKLSEGTKKLKDKDDYDSARPFEKELADTLSNLSSESLRKKSDRISSLYKEDLDIGNYRRKNTVEEYLEKKIQEQYTETDTISPLPRDKYDNRSAFVDNVGSFKGLAVNGRDHKHLLGTKESFKPFERSCSSLENRIGDIKPSPSSEELGTTTHKKRSSDILEDLRHLEAKTSNDGNADTSMLTRQTGYDWEDLKKLEARRQDNFSDSASGFSRGRLDVPSINVFGEPRKSYVVEPKMELQEGSDSILNTYSRKKSNGEPDDDRESKLGVWTKVKPRANRDNGRRSSDRALKIIQENSAILHKILTCQAKKRLPDLEEISKEITISPINEEISKIFSPILEKMGLNEHEINEELARINFQDFDQMTATSGSEFDAKINDELCKLSLIDDSEVVDHLDVDEIAARDYLDTREALIDRQINEELSKLLANYEEASPACIANREESSSCQNPSELEGLELSSISNNVFAYQSSTDSIETKSELGSIQDSAMQLEKYPPYSEDILSFAQTPKYSLRGLSPRSDIDIYRELEKLDKISSGEILPSASATIPQKINSPMSYANECPPYAEVRPSSLEYCIKPEKSFDPSPMKSPYDTYKPYDFKSRISPRKTPSNPYSARSYEKAGGMDSSFNFHDDLTTPSRLYDLGTSRPILSKETLEFRVRYDDESSKQICSDDLSLEPYQRDFVDLSRGASYYSNEPSVSLKRLSTESERTLNPSGVPPLDYTYNETHKYDPLSLQNYVYPKTTSDHDKPSYKLDKDDEAGSYLSLRQKNSHSLSPNYQYADRDFASTMNSYATELPQSLEDASKRPGSHPEFAENISSIYTEASTRDSISFRKASMSLGLNETMTSRTNLGIDAKPSPGSLFSPFPVRNASRKPKELGLKLGLYSPNSPGSTPLKRP